MSYKYTDLAYPVAEGFWFVRSEWKVIKVRLTRGRLPDGRKRMLNCCENCMIPAENDYLWTGPIPTPDEIDDETKYMKKKPAKKKGVIK